LARKKNRRVKHCQESLNLAVKHRKVRKGWWLINDWPLLPFLESKTLIEQTKIPQMKTFPP